MSPNYLQRDLRYHGAIMLYGYIQAETIGHVTIIIYV